jgi:hypothetical protein
LLNSRHVSSLPERYAMKRRLSKVLTTALSLGLIVAGGVTAYFTNQASTQQIVVSTGTLAIEVDETLPLQFNNLLPGEEREVSWTVTNTGSTGVNLKGQIEGSWDDEVLVDGGLLVTDLEAFVDNNWLSLESDPAGISNEFYLSPTQSEIDLLELDVSQELPMRMKFSLEADIADEYQAQAYGLSVHLAAKQTNDGAVWPSSY